MEPDPHRRRAGSCRPDLDVELVYRFIRDTVWVAVRWYNPYGALSANTVAEQYLGILLDGIATPGPISPRGGRAKNG